MSDQMDERPEPPLEGEVSMRGERIENAFAMVETNAGIIGGLTRAEIDVQISTAKQYPRTISAVRRMVETLATLDTETATSCFYRLKRGKEQVEGKWVDKYIEGPTVRFAEIVAQSWGNCRLASRRTDITAEDIEATGVFHDLESNIAWAKSVRRSIMTSASGGKTPQRFNADMINVASNAAASIALRNAILTAVPKGFWAQGYRKAREVSKGDVATLGERRKAMLGSFKEAGVAQEQLFELLGVRGLDDINLDIMFDAGGMLNAIRDGDATLAELLAEARADRPAPTLAGAFDAAGGKKGGLKPKAAATVAHDAKTGEVIEGETVGAGKPAQSAAAPKTTAASATDASGGSQGATSGQKPAAEPSAAFMQPQKGHAKPGVLYHLVEDEPGEDGLPTYKDGVRVGVASHKERRPVYAEHASVIAVTEPEPEPEEEIQPGQEDEHGQEESRPISDASPADGYDIEAFNAFAEEINAKDSWLTIKSALGKFQKTEAYAAADADMKTRARLVAYNATVALVEAGKDPVSHKTDPSFFLLWLLQAEPHERRPAFAALVRSPTYQALSEDVKEHVAREAIGEG